MTVKREECAAAESSDNTQKAQIKGDGAANDIHIYSDDSDRTVSEGETSDLEVGGPDQTDLEDEWFPEDDLLKEALQQYEDNMINELLSDTGDEKPFALSPEGRKNMEQLFTQWLGPEKAREIMDQEKKNYREDLRRWKQRRNARLLQYLKKGGMVAAAAVVVVILSIANFDDSLAFKLPEAGFEAVLKEDYTKLLPEKFIYNNNFGESEQNNTYEKNRYVLGRIIPNYRLIDSVDTYFVSYDIYENEETDDRYIFYQQRDSIKLGVNTEYSNVQELNTMYGLAQLYQFESGYGLAWQYNGYLFRIEGKLTEEQLTDLQESLRSEVKE
ncbi:hypothetical protein HNP82_000546 [Catenibacillus scindens]|uniref:DUF4367 domain-containing protein n=1 Tax=Catenibacillus scindens TaxID=673271 RepID=A0A7W8M4C2_9FIRM|nr:DUF4367 domain-containing protein [Catenibacillus scindens]MBB5263452.1 hypothetical protein [Catenibacillus scindens]